MCITRCSNNTKTFKLHNWLVISNSAKCKIIAGYIYSNRNHVCLILRRTEKVSFSVYVFCYPCNKAYPTVHWPNNAFPCRNGKSYKYVLKVYNIYRMHCMVSFFESRRIFISRNYVPNHRRKIEKKINFI